MYEYDQNDFVKNWQAPRDDAQFAFEQRLWKSALGRLQAGEAACAPCRALAFLHANDRSVQPCPQHQSQRVGMLARLDW